MRINIKSFDSVLRALITYAMRSTAFSRRLSFPCAKGHFFYLKGNYKSYSISAST